MTTPLRQDTVELFDFVWRRLDDRLAGLSDAEWQWCPTADDRISLRWRLAHITELLTEPRNAQWLGLGARAEVERPATTSAAAALASLGRAFDAWRALLTDSALDLSAPIGQAAGPYAQSTRHSFVLHIADELIHHGAESALLRDLYPG